VTEQLQVIKLLTFQDNAAEGMKRLTASKLLQKGQIAILNVLLQLFDLIINKELGFYSTLIYNFTNTHLNV